MSQIVTRRLLISGRVQGVGYRVSLVAVAEQLGLKGWVRNRRDGGVEAVIQGEAKAVEDLAAWAQQGPPHARVEQVQGSDVATEDSGPFVGFHVRADD